MNGKPIEYDTREHRTALLLTFLMLALNLGTVAIMLECEVGPSGGITWQFWQMLFLPASSTLAIQLLSFGSGLSMVPAFSGLVTWLIVPVGWLVEVARTGQLQGASKAFLYTGPCSGVLLSFVAALFVLLFEKRHR
ncbi:hypothetical protein C7431_11193 [Pantoea allii]|uniref:Uncharacterized protein n=1 Tax=Pantoea allii TaxID=574096 RepID=A0A2V2BFP2_9GAMM|nr:hypothetical protein [Pantoea allii]PWK94356.1 hypothetical protein C7431_11193 [Pantoea allii]